ncbi:type VI secretion system Vgr family protein [Paludibacterium purpuratum]|uniref:Type VI secretion system secreted protein VgrG n=1 Tax=Paludibacterium purpuratum TaxID=1144873 RepID=A0A4R7BCQ3_9NEIS|nr:type VI secretion system Vgr family protein [Paludibacterium purpuratum]TDR82728.1 type VI secretion system secreted protein VgrG [Paludibacterium purpuratum]
MDVSSLLAAFASAFTQDRRLLSLQLGDDGQWDGRLLPQSVDGEEAVSDNYRYSVDCLSPDANLALKNLLGLSARLAIRDQNGEEVVRAGVVTQAQALGSDGGFSRYRLVLEPPFALLRHRTTSRVFQDLSVPDIVKQVIAEHQANNPVFARLQTLAIELTRPAAPRSYTLQYRESDLAFLTRLLAEEGLGWRFHTADGHIQLTVFDDPYSLPQSSQQRVRFHRSDATEAEDGLTEWQARQSLATRQVSLASFDYKAVQTGQGMDSSQRPDQPAERSLESYDPQSLYYASDADGLTRYAQLRQQAHDLAAQGFQGSGTARGLHAGHWFRLDEHPLYERKPVDQREFVVTRQSFQARNNLPEGLAQQLISASDSPPYRTQFDAQPRGLPLSPAYSGTEHAKPTALGAQTATVVGPGGEEVHTDEQGRIKVQFHWARNQEHPEAGAGFDERSSCWVRVAMPSAGAAWGHQFIPRIGQEVLIDFIEGDIDRPVVTGVLYNGSHNPPSFSASGALPGNKTLSGIKSKEHQGGGHNELLFDDTPNQVRSRLASSHGATQLNQGFLTHPRADGKAEARGEGFELRTDQHGAVRAAHGLLLSTEAQQGAAGNQLARASAQAQLDAALALSQSLGDVATAQLADTVDIEPQKKLDEQSKAWETGSNTGLNGQGTGQQPILVMSAPAGIASLTEQSQTVAAGSNLDLVAQRDVNHTAGRRWLANVGQHISLFVAGVKDVISLKLIASKGKVQVQAQSGEMELTAEQALSITSVNGKQLYNGKKEVLLTCGGAYIRIADGKIELHAPGKVSIKGTSQIMDGPTSLNLQPPSVPFMQKQAYSQRFNLRQAMRGDPTLRQSPYKVVDSQGKTLASGNLDNGGSTDTVFTKQAENIETYVGNGQWTLVSHVPTNPDELDGETQHVAG